MAFDFSASPTVGQKYPASPVAGVQYTWDGEKWTMSLSAAATYSAMTAGAIQIISTR